MIPFRSTRISVHSHRLGGFTHPRLSPVVGREDVHAVDEKTDAARPGDRLNLRFLNNKGDRHGRAQRSTQAED